MCVTTPVYDEDMSDAASSLHFVADNWWIQAVLNYVVEFCSDHLDILFITLVKYARVFLHVELSQLNIQSAKTNTSCGGNDSEKIYKMTNIKSTNQVLNYC